MVTGYSVNYTNTKGSNTPASKTGDVRYSHKRLLIICLILIIPKVVRRLSL